MPYACATGVTSSADGVGAWLMGKQATACGGKMIAAQIRRLVPYPPATLLSSIRLFSRIAAVENRTFSAFMTMS